MRYTVLRVLMVLLAGACSHGPPTHDLVLLDGDGVRIPQSTVADGNVHFFTFELDGKNVNFLVRTDGDGTIHTHLDACYACYRYKRGFVVEKSHLVCIACRLEYAISDEVWDYIGACAPISIHSSIENNHLLIKESVLTRAARYF